MNKNTLIVTHDNYLKLAISDITSSLHSNINVAIIDNRFFGCEMYFPDFLEKNDLTDHRIIYLRFRPFAPPPALNIKYDICGNITPVLIRRAYESVIKSGPDPLCLEKCATDIGGYISYTEKKIMRLSLTGMSVKDVASELNLSQKTIYYHRLSFMKKLGFRNYKAFSVWFLQCHSHKMFFYNKM